MTISYPENTVWYIEARPWNGPDLQHPGFAQAKPVSQGSGVVVTFIKVKPDGTREPRSYILTCAHVVRNASDLLLKDIICYPPGKGFFKTDGTNRKSGQKIAQALPAKVSEYSPCKGIADPREAELLNLPCRDWVLLELPAASFQKQQAINELHEIDILNNQKFQLIGFPGGAALWEDGDMVSAIIARDFRLAAHSEAGMIDYEGPEETRSGMSGGGIFDDAGSLVGIHRSNSDAVMRRGGIRADAIARYLRETHQLEFATKSLLLHSMPQDDHPVVDIARPIEGQIQLFAQDEVSFVGSPVFEHGEQIWLGHHWEDAKSDKIYIVWGIQGQPITPQFKGFDLTQPFTNLKLKVSFTRYRDKPRDLRGPSETVPKK